MVLKKNVLLLVYVVNLCFYSNSQELKILRATISSSGGVGSLQTGGASILVQQSVGQSGVTGTSFTDALILREGFIQPFTTYSYQSSDLDNKELSVSVFPNPFSDELVIEFQEELLGSFVNVKICDSYGKLSYEMEFDSQQEIALYLASVELADGVYFLTVSNGKKHKIVKLIHA